MGLVISLFGPPFSGKTYLTTNLICDFEDFEIVIFEKFFSQNDIQGSYLKFFDEINKHLSNKRNVIAESVYCISNNPKVSIKYKDEIDILCWPSLEKYKKNYGNYLNKFGFNITKRRLHSNDLIKTRQDFRSKIPKEHIVFDGTNYNTIKREISKRICI